MPTFLRLFRRGSASVAGEGAEALEPVTAGVDPVTTLVEREDDGPAFPPRCRDQATRLIRKYAAFGTVWAILPVPMATSAGLALLETHLIYWIARIYGEQPKKTDVLMTAAGLELASVALKTVAIEGAALVPVVGLGVKAGIAGGVVLAIGEAIVRHYEEKYPDQRVAA